MSRTEHLALDFEIKFATGKAGTFSGYGAVFSNVDSHGDVIQKGAFANSLREWSAKGKLPPMLLQHGGFFGSVDDMLPIGRWTSMSEDDHGLKAEGELIALGTERGQYIHEGLKSGALDGLSIGYRPKKFIMGTKTGEPRRTLQEVDLVELSIVLFPSNDEARVGDAKADMASAIEDPRAFEKFLRVAGFPRAFAKAVTASGFRAAAGMRNSNAERRAELARAIHAARAIIGASK